MAPKLASSHSLGTGPRPGNGLRPGADQRPGTGRKPSWFASAQARGTATAWQQPGRARCPDIQQTKPTLQCTCR